MNADESSAGTTTDERVEPVEEQANPRIAELEGRHLRALADLDNLRKRFEREVGRERAVERARVTAAWLPVVDDLERAIQHATAAEGSILEGVRAVHQHALDVLERLGFPRFEDVGAPFDPLRHEAVSSVEAASPPGTVVATVRPGYGTDEEILRPASVVVSKSPG
jgi:molecular chaperone GrpE